MIKQIKSVATLSVSEETTLSFTFTFPIFFALPAVVGQKRLTSPPIADHKGRKWWLEVCPDGSSVATATSVSAVVGFSHTMTGVSYEVMLMHRSKNPTQCYTRSWLCEHVAAGSLHGMDSLISRESLLDNFVMDNGTVVFHVAIKFQDKADRKQPAVIHPVQGQSDLMDSPIRSLYMNQEYADMTLIVGEKRLRAHKFVLCPRSAVFHAMFVHPMQETRTNEIVVSDEYSAAAVKAMLHFLYADMIAVDTLQAQSPQLLALASYYQIENLQEYVEDNVIITLDNVRALLQAAQLHGSKGFLQRTLQFVVGHGQQLFNQQEFLDSLDSKTNKLVQLAAIGATKSE